MDYVDMRCICLLVFRTVVDRQACGGWGGIRTPGEPEPTPVFKTGALNHSATHPWLCFNYLPNLLPGTIPELAADVSDHLSDARPVALGATLLRLHRALRAGARVGRLIGEPPEPLYVSRRVCNDTPSAETADQALSQREAGLRGEGGQRPAPERTEAEDFLRAHLA
jgi:hypothetical protein